MTNYALKRMIRRVLAPSRVQPIATTGPRLLRGKSSRHASWAQRND